MSDRADQLLRAVLALEDHRPPKGIGFPMWNERRRKLLTEVRAYLSENQPNRADELLTREKLNAMYEMADTCAIGGNLLRSLLNMARAYLSENQPINDAGQCESARTGENRLVDRPIGSATTEAPVSPHQPIAACQTCGATAEYDFAKCAAKGPILERCPLAPKTQQPTWTKEQIEWVNRELLGVAEQKWPHTVDAAVWAREFCARFDITNAIVGEGDGDKESTMVGWFANAIMAGYDTAQSRATPIQQTAQPVAWNDAQLDELVAELRDYQEWARKNRKRNSCWQDLDFAADAIQTLRARLAETPLYAAAQLIPREPTDEMNAAARRRVGFACPDLWHAMWDAAAKSAEP